MIKHINKQAREVVATYNTVLSVRTNQYEYVTGHDTLTGLGSYCVWDAHSNLQCLVEQVPNACLERITALMMGTYSTTEARNKLIEELEISWEILPMEPTLKQLILS